MGNYSKIRVLTDIFFSKIALVGIVFVTDIFLARMMSVSDRGAVLALNSSIFFCATVITFGLEYGFLLIPEVPSIRTLFKTYSKILPGLLCIGALTAHLISIRYHLNLYNTAFLVLLMLCEIATILILPCLLQYISAISYGLARVARRFLALAMIALGFMLVKPSLLEIHHVLFSFALSWFVTLMAGYLLLRRSFSNQTESTSDRLTYRSLVKPGSSIFLAKICERFQTQVGLIILGFLGYTTAASLYAIGAQAAEVAVFASGSISIGLLAKKNNANLLNKKEVFRLFVCVIILAFVGITVIWSFLPQLIVTIYGGGYHESASLIKMLAPALVIYSGYPLISTFLLRNGNSALIIFANFFSVILNSTACLLSITIFNVSPPKAATLSLLMALLSNILIVFLGGRKALQSSD